MNITDPDVEDYIRGLLDRHDEPVLLEMEAEGKERGFPIVGRMVGVALEILARAIGANRVIELVRVERQSIPAQHHVAGRHPALLEPLEAGTNVR